MQLMTSKLSQAVFRAGGLSAFVRKALKLIASQGWPGFIEGLDRAKNFGRLQICNPRIYREWLSLFESQKTMVIATSHNSTCAINVIVYAPRDESTHINPIVESLENQTHTNWRAIIICEDSLQAPTLKSFIGNRNTDRWSVLVRPTKEDLKYLLEGCTWITINFGSKIYAKHTLSEIANHSQQSEARIIYCDEDVIDEQGRRSHPHFKPDWNPDLLRSYNYLAEAVFYHRDIAFRLGDFEAKVSEKAIYSLALQATNSCKDTEIVHIPKPLVHSLRPTNHSRGTRTEAAHALMSYYKQTGIAAHVEVTPTTIRTRYSVPHPEPLVSIIIPTKDKKSLLQQCIDSIISTTTYRNFELIIVDNDSSEELTLRYLDFLKTQTRTFIIRDSRSFNYSALMNNAANQANGEILCMLNNDTEVISPDWLTEMVGHILRPEVGVVGAKLLYPDNTVQHAGVVLGIGGCAGHAHRGFKKHDPGYFSRAEVVSNYSAVTGACLVTTKKIYQSLGGFDEENLAISYNDIDFCLEAKEAGLLTVWTPYAILYHHESASRTTDEKPSERDRALQEETFFLEKWGNKLQYDTAYNINLTLKHENFSLAYPPRPYTFKT